MEDVQVTKFQMMNIVTFVTSYLKNFHTVRAIPDVMLDKVPHDNELIPI